MTEASGLILTFAAGKAALEIFMNLTGATKGALAAAQAAFQINSMVLANGRDSGWSDPDIGDWQGDSGTLHGRFDWAA